MLQITQSSQRDGLTFSLNPRSQLKLLQVEPKIHPLPRVFIAFDTASDLQDYRGDLYEQIAQLLTQLSEEELMEKFGGYEVVDPVTGQRFYPNA
ncbi:MAG TPA: hypothetical protein VG537_07930 [Candidatus Kapabacteria bacterium]|jgi:hypothetical protein|nr:hypothetical protein [Candidatus Kapabacteria bacterium]